MESRIKQVFWSLMCVMLLVIISAGWSLSGVLRSQVSQARVITVSGEGKVKTAPDISLISFSVITEGKDAKVIKEEGVKKMNAAIAFIKTQGIEAKDIKTEQFSLSPRYSWIMNTGKNMLDGYTFTQSASIKVRDFEKAGDILTGLPEYGINQIQGPNLTIEDPEKYRVEARSKAFKNAREKVEAMAKENGVSIRNVVTFSESGDNYPMPMYGRMEMAVMDSSAPKATTPTIEAGENEVIVNVSVTYEIE